MLGLIRSFIAFDIKDKGILERLSEAQEKLRRTGADLKLVRLENIHITMRFLGNIEPNIVDKIFNQMEQVSFTPFDVEIRGVGAFPKPQYVRVVWAGIQSGVKNLKDISGQLEPRLRSLGIKPDTKGFSPHITIARVRKGFRNPELAQCLSQLADYEFGVTKLNCLKLMKSVLTSKGPVYSTLKQVCR